MNIFIDLGAFDGDTIKEFLKWQYITGKKDWKIYGFEPNPDCIDQINWLNNNYSNVNIYNKAAWNCKDSIEFTVRPKSTPLGSTAIKAKRDWGQGQVIRVAAIDFSEWLKENVKKKDYVIVKCDIEGSEYPVLKKVIDDGNDKLIDLIMVEWHDSKIRSNLPKQRGYIDETFKDRLKEWV